MCSRMRESAFGTVLWFSSRLYTLTFLTEDGKMGII